MRKDGTTSNDLALQWLAAEKRYRRFDCGFRYPLADGGHSGTKVRGEQRSITQREQTLIDRGRSFRPSPSSNAKTSAA